jgi:hypothetical protein
MCGLEHLLHKGLSRSCTARWLREATRPYYIFTRRRRPCILTVHRLIVHRMYTRRQQYVIEQNSLRPRPERCLHLHTPAPLATYRSSATTRGESADGRCHSGNSDCVSLHDALFKSPYPRKPVTGQRPQHKYVMRPGRQYFASLVGDLGHYS